MSICRKSAALILIREDFNVLLLKRNNEISFGGSFAFPGGALEEQDFQIAKDNSQQIEKLHSKYYHKQFDWYQASLIAAIRETNEETNINLDYQKAYQNMKPFIRIITPQMMKKRYDTQFFIIKSNQYNTLDINKSESMSYEWNTPTEFLLKYINNQINLFPPVYLQLLILKQLGSIENIFKYIDSGEQYKHTYPHIFQFTKRFIFNYPDPNYNKQKLIEQESSEYLKKELEIVYQFDNRTDFKLEIDGQLQSFTGHFGNFQNSPLTLLKGNLISNNKFVENQPKL